MTIEELKDWFAQTAKIITDLHICLDNAKRLFDNKYENEDWIKDHGFFRHHYYQLWFIISIQLCKLLSKSKNQKYNFNKLLNRLELEELDGEIFQLLAHSYDKEFTCVFRSREEMLNRISFYKQEVKRNEVVIEKFISSRDTLYAHRDPNAKLQGLTLQDADQLIGLCEEIYNCFRGGIFDKHFDFSHTGDWSIDFVLKQAALARSIRDNKA